MKTPITIIMVAFCTAVNAQQSPPTDPFSYCSAERNQSMDAADRLAAANAQLQQKITDLQRRLDVLEKPPAASQIPQQP